MNLLSDIITYIRRIIKTPSNASITDDLLIDYINRFWIMDVDARIQLFDLKTKYQFQTVPGVDQYNMPLYNVQIEGGQTVGPYPVYQGFLEPAYVNGVQILFQTQEQAFFNLYPKVVQQMNVVAIGDGTAGPYQIKFPILGNPYPYPFGFGNSPYLNLPIEYILRGHVDITGIIATGVNQDPIFSNDLNPLVPSTSIYPAVYYTSIDAFGNSVVVQDSGEFLLDAANNAQANLGLLMIPGNAPFAYGSLAPYSALAVITGVTQANPAVVTAVNAFVPGQIVQISGVNGMTQLNGNYYVVTASTGVNFTINVDSTGFTAYINGGSAVTFNNVINYLTGFANVTFPVDIPLGRQINGQCFFFQTGLPRAVLFYNNTLTFRSPPDRQYLVEIEAYLSPSAFFNTANAIPFGYMAEYIARGAARKILSDTGDAEQLAFYEPLFREQEMLVWKRSQRQFTASRTQTIYSQGINSGISNGNMGQGWS